MRTDFDARALGRGVAREGLSLLAHAALFGFGYLPNRHQPRRAKEQRTLVFVHGLGGNRAGFFPLQAYLRLCGHERQYSFNYAHRGSIEAMAVELKERLAKEIRGGRIDLICHSMGGLIARYYVQALGGERRVDRLITLATPHRGSHPSVYVPTPLLWQFKPGGAFLAHLDSLPPPRRTRVFSFAASEDHLVLPAEASLAPFGETKTFPHLGHQSLLLSPAVFAEVEAALRAPLPKAPA